MVAGRAEDADERLLIEHCGSCGRWVHPPAGSCPDCGGQLTAEPVSGHGTVFTYTVNVQPFNPAIPTPYVIAIVELDEQHGLRLAANIVDCEPDSVFCGMPVQLQPQTDTKAPNSASEKGVLRLLAVPT
ncbi:MAG TPA: OB-fold domain-containing protein [Mycobacterium sp.]|nr:OB-fold domain-containing protein [Mycobacterium sp.]